MNKLPKIMLCLFLAGLINLPAGAQEISTTNNSQNSQIKLTRNDYRKLAERTVLLFKFTSKKYSRSIRRKILFEITTPENFKKEFSQKLREMSNIYFTEIQVADAQNFKHYYLQFQVKEMNKVEISVGVKKGCSGGGSLYVFKKIRGNWTILKGNGGWSSDCSADNILPRDEKQKPIVQSAKYFYI